MTKPLILWILCDGKPGHENQSLGLAEAVARLVPTEIHRISLGKSGPFARFRTANSCAETLPKPDWILAAGHSTHLILWRLAQKHHAKSIVLMRPSLPIGIDCFDFCIAPSHDFPSGSSRPNLFLTHGALNCVTPGDQSKSGKLILLGGPSKTHGWDSSEMLEALESITQNSDDWEISDSRRTPEGFLDQVRAKFPGLTIFPHSQTPHGWVPEKLRAAREVWVTEDSVSMVHEALTSGASVGLLPMPRLVKKSRVLQGMETLIDEGFLTPFSQWKKTSQLAEAPRRLAEADRAAKWLLKINGLRTHSRVGKVSVKKPNSSRRKR